MESSAFYWNYLFKALIMNSDNSSKFVVLFCFFKVHLKLKPSIHNLSYQMKYVLISALSIDICKKKKTTKILLVVNSTTNVNQLTFLQTSFLLPLCINICLCLTFWIHEHLFQKDLKVFDIAKHPNIFEVVIHWHSDIFRIS